MDAQLEREVYLLHERICQALADPKRVLILYALAEGARCVSDLVEELALPQPTVSRHLGVLRQRELVRAERRGTAVYYTLTDHRIIDALDTLRAILAAQLSAGADLLRDRR